MKTKLFLIFILVILCFNIKKTKAQTWSALGSGLEYPVNSFTLYNGNLCSASYGVQVWNGSTWTDMSTGLRALFGSGDVYALANFNSALFAGGRFTVFTPDGNWYNNAAKFSNASWTTCGSGKGNDGSGMSDQVNSLIEYNGQLYAGGRFNSAGGDPLYPTAATYIAGFDGAEWHSVGGGMDYTVTDMVVYNGDLVVSGYFTRAAYLNSAGEENTGSISANYIAKWNGVNWSALGSGMDGKVTALAIHNGELYAGGLFGNAGGVPANSIAKWNGLSWSPVGNGITGGGQVYTLASYNNELFAGGEFTTGGGNAGNYIMSWDGTQWKSVGSGTDDPVITLLPDGSGLIVGGSFSTAGNVSANHVAKLSGTTGIQGNFINNAISIFPNPTTGKFTVEDKGELTIYNLHGEKILSKKLVSQKSEIDLSNQPKGIYFVKFYNGAKIHTEKIVIQ